MNTLLYILMYGVVIYACILALSQSIRLKISLRYLSKNKKNSNSIPNNKKIIILIPVYHEFSIIAKTIKYFSRLYNKHVSIVFITTEKEGNPKNNLTHIAISKVASKNISIMHYPYTYGDKSSQINFAIKTLSKLGVTKEAYFAIFDADSRPNPEGIRYVLNDVKSEPIYQMLSIYSNNYSSISPINKANALFQSRWSLSFEGYHMKRNYESQKLTIPMYLIGHGLFIRADVASLNKFPQKTLAEDISLGYRLCYKEIYPKLVPYFDYCSVPSSIIINIKQSARWFAGEFSLWREFMYASKKSWSFRRMILTLKRFFYLVQWIVGPIIIILSLIASLILKEYLLLSMLLFFVLVYVFYLHHITRIVFNKKNINDTISIYLYLALKSVLDCLGPIYAIYRIILSKLGICKYDFFKTPR